jgi:hypothetical protein
MIEAILTGLKIGIEIFITDNFHNFEFTIRHTSYTQLGRQLAHVESGAAQLAEHCRSARGRVGNIEKTSPKQRPLNPHMVTMW